MAKSFRLTPKRAAWAGNAQWWISIPPRYSETGKRQRHFFETQQSAKNFSETTAIRVENFGVQGSAILPPSDQEQAANAIEALKPYRVTLNEVVQDWISRKQATDASVSFEEGMDAFLAWGRRSPSYVRSIRQTRNRRESLHGKQLSHLSRGLCVRMLQRCLARPSFILKKEKERE
jgi:hypothetical protein